MKISQIKKPWRVPQGLMGVTDSIPSCLEYIPLTKNRYLPLAHSLRRDNVDR